MSTILAGLIFGGFGLIFFRIGKKNSNFALLIVGLTSLIYPYFVTGPYLTWGIGIGLCVTAKYVWNSEF